MMVRRILLFAPLFFLAFAQLPPAIIRFSADLSQITLDAVESGFTTINLEWETINMTEQHRLILEQYTLGEWSLLLPEPEYMPPNFSATITAEHPHNFGPLIYRLSLLDASNRSLDMAIVTIEIAPPRNTTTRIDLFETSVESVDSSMLMADALTLPVQWEVRGRLPLTNLVFDQILPDGSAVSAELPRSSLWVPSAGTGIVRVQDVADVLRFRLRVVDIQTQQIYAETVTDVAVIDNPGGVSLQPGNVELMRFDVSPLPINRNRPVNIQWDIPGATTVTLHILNLMTKSNSPYWSPVTSIAGTTVPNLPPSGNLSYNIPRFYRELGGTKFRLEATAANGQVFQFDTPELPFVCHPTLIDPNNCTDFPIETTPAVFQPYEGGLIIWRESWGDFLVFYDFDETGIVGWRRFVDDWQLGEAVILDETPPDGLMLPEDRFAKLWAEHEEVSLLGWATAPPQGYIMRSQLSLHGYAASFDTEYLSLPDSRILSRILGGYDADSGPGWGYYSG